MSISSSAWKRITFRIQRWSCMDISSLASYNLKELQFMWPRHFFMWLGTCRSPHFIYWCSQAIPLVSLNPKELLLTLTQCIYPCDMELAVAHIPWLSCQLPVEKPVWPFPNLDNKAWFTYLMGPVEVQIANFPTSEALHTHKKWKLIIVYVHILEKDKFLSSSIKKSLVIIS